MIWTAGDIVDLLAPYSREASVFMIRPESGDNLQQVQIWDLRPLEKRDENTPEDAHSFFRPIVFTIGEHGPFDSRDLYSIQQKRERRGRHLVGLTWQDMQEIDRLCNRICQENLFSGKSDQEVYEEVLKQFKESRYEQMD